MYEYKYTVMSQCKCIHQCPSYVTVAYTVLMYNYEYTVVLSKATKGDQNSQPIIKCEGTGIIIYLRIKHQS